MNRKEKQRPDRNGMKKMICMFIVVFFAAALPEEASASVMEAAAEDIVVTGERMSLEDYKDLYSGPFDERKSREELLTYQSATLEIDAITVINDAIEFDYRLGTYEASMEGILYNSLRDQGSMVAVFEDSGEYEVLFFEISTGTQMFNLMYNRELNGKPHIKIYLRSSQDEMYLFETALPDSLSNLSLDKEEHCNIYDDYLWYVPIVDSYETDTHKDKLSESDDMSSEDYIEQQIAIAGNRPYGSGASWLSIHAVCSGMMGRMPLPNLSR